jgi:hypothetical protein
MDGPRGVWVLTSNPPDGVESEPWVWEVPAGAEVGLITREYEIPD